MSILAGQGISAHILGLILRGGSNVRETSQMDGTLNIVGFPYKETWPQVKVVKRSSKEAPRTRKYYGPAF